MTLKTAITTLAAISFPGVKRSYDLDDLRGVVHPPDLPALLPLPNTGENERDSYGYGGASFMKTHQIRHRLLERPANDTAIMGEAMANIVTLIDSYQTTIQELVTHAGAADVNITNYEAGEVEWSKVKYFGCDFFIEVKIIE